MQLLLFTFGVRIGTFYGEEAIFSASSAFIREEKEKNGLMLIKGIMHVMMPSRLCLVEVQERQVKGEGPFYP